MTVASQATALLDGLRAEAARDPLGAAVWFSVLTAAGIATDFAGAEWATGMIVLGGILSFAGQYSVTRRTMRRGALLSANVPGTIGAFFILSIVANLAIVIGTLLLVVPGLWLAARWLAAVPVLFAEDTGPSDSLGRSVARMTGRVGAAMLAIAIVYVPFGLALAYIAVGEWIGREADTLDVILTNLAITLSQMALWYLGIAAYPLTLHEPLAQVFD